jgi:hypothetical protein
MTISENGLNRARQSRRTFIPDATLQTDEAACYMTIGKRHFVEGVTA